MPVTPEAPNNKRTWKSRSGSMLEFDDTTGAGYVDTGAIYDLSKPTRNAMRPIGEWNHAEITCRDAVIEVVLNGEKVNTIDLAKFTEPNKRPDGTAHLMRGIIVFTVRDGLITFARFFLEPVDASRTGVDSAIELQVGPEVTP